MVGGMQPEQDGPFSPSALHDPGIVSDTIEGYALWHVLGQLPSAPIAAEAAAETASTDSTDLALAQTTYLRSLAMSTLTSTNEQLSFPLTTKRARALGICVAATTLESVADFYSYYGVEILAEDIRAQASRITNSGAAEYAEPERLDIWLQALLMAEDDIQMQLAQTLMDGIRKRVEKMSPRAQAQEAIKLLQRLDREGEDGGGQGSPWSTGIVVDPAFESMAITQITNVSPFARGALQLFKDEAPFEPHLTPYDLYAEGIRRTLAFAGRGVLLMSIQE